MIGGNIPAVSDVLREVNQLLHRTITMPGYYTKLAAGITESTIWQAPDPTRLVWITMLSLADQHGYVGASIPGLAARARVKLEDCITALDYLKAPDEYSRTREHEGRRIADAEGGWVLLNHGKYRAMQSADERRERSRLAMQKLREERRLTKDNSEPPLTKLTQAEAEAEVKAKEVKKKDCAPTVPSGVSVQVWNDFLKARRALRAPVTATALKGIEREAVKAGLTLEAALQICCERSWRGFKAEWLEGKGNPLTAAEQALQMMEERDRAQG